MIGLSVRPAGYAQSLSNKREKDIALTDTLTLDTLSIIPSSFSIRQEGKQVPESLYKLDFTSAFLTIYLDKWAAAGMNEAPLTVSYRTFSVLLTASVKDPTKQHLISEWKMPGSKAAPLAYNTKDPLQRSQLFSMDGIAKSGSLTRGIAFGNAQDASLVSSFNLQLAGKLNNDIEILATITDENIPVQPDGNTQQLQDFDKIFIQLSKGSTQVIGGDFFMTKPTGYFLNVNKRAQGLSVRSGIPNHRMFKREEQGSLRGHVAGAVARGKFRRQEMMGVEGNQGPYRLSGNEGELFIVVLSGTETVFIDGKKMERGQENDYIIDYNTAEIRFTSNRLITKDSRMVVEFEYSDRNYQRWMVQAGNEWNYKGFSYRLNFFTEFDDKNVPLGQTLSDTQKVILSQIGDNLEQAFAPAVDSVDYNTNEVLYKKIDTTVFAHSYIIYVHSIHPDSAIYRLRFSDVGQGNGNYILEPSDANGKVFKWVAPNADSTKNGRYEPVVLLVTPKSHLMATFGANYQIGKKWEIDAEGALSRYDKNTFSSLHASDDLGYAFRVKASYKANLNKKEKDTLQLTSTVMYEQVNENFVPVIRFRTVEFERDWNFINRNNPKSQIQKSFHATDYIPQFSLQLTQSSWGKVILGSGLYLKGKDYTAFRNQVSADVMYKRWEIKWDASQLASYDTLENSLFIRQRLLAARHWKVLSVGVQGETEYNAFHNIATDSLERNSYMFNEWEFFMQQGKTNQHKWRIFYKNRLDHLAGENNGLDMAAIAHITGASFELKPTDHHFFKSLVSYRYLQVTDTMLLKRTNENSLLARIEYNGTYAKGAIQFNVFYETGSGMENKRDYQYIQSVNALGTHVWIDYNGDGIKQRDEFEIRSGTIVGTDGLTYVKFYIPTAEFIRTYYNQFTSSLNIQAPTDWRKSKGWKKVLSRFSLQTSVKTERKTQQDNFAASFNPFQIETSDTSLMSLNYAFRQTLYFNRFQSKIGFELNYFDNRQKMLMSNGLDSRNHQYGTVRLRWAFVRMFSFNLESTGGKKIYESQWLRKRNYHILYADLKPEFIFQPNAKWRVGATYRMIYKENKGMSGDTLTPGGEIARIHDWGLDLKTNFIAKGQLQVRGNLIWISYNGTPNTALSFEMLESLKSGINVTWGASFQRTIGNYLQITLQYDGRKSEGAPFVHIASMQVRAFF